MQKVAIIGAGPAGIFLSLLLKDFAGEITLFEQNARIGEKLRLTGGGRMNVTNSTLASTHYHSHAPHLLNNLFKSPWVRKLPELLQELGIKYIFEGHRALLKSASAVQEVERLFRSLSKQANLNLQLGTEVIEIHRVQEKFQVATRNSTEIFDNVVLCQGGMLRGRKLFSPHEIYQLALSLGHTVTPLRPALHALKVPDFKLAELAGLSFTGILSAPKVSGELLITHQGFSGPAALDFSLYHPSGKFKVNFLPEFNAESLQQTLNALRQGKNLLRKFLQERLPKRLASFFLQTLGLPEETVVSSLSHENLSKLTKLLCASEFEQVSEKLYQGAWTTCGGVPLAELRVATLESKLTPGLFFAGEMLDCNGRCGGYNISFALLSAKLVSEALLKV